jgi:dsRNA-specific ribonuclease
MSNENRQMETMSGIYFGPRGDEFKTHIINILKRGKIKQKYIDLLTNSENMQKYASAYTSELVDELYNYQVYEQLGDLSCNKFIVWYIYSRFPQLKCAEGVKVAARIRINYGSKNTFCKIAENLGCWKFITTTNDLRQRKKKPLLEDVFEAFIGVTESILDNLFRIGVGYACVYKILKSIFDEMDMSLKYEDLYDAKTRLKELFDIHTEQLGTLVYEEQKNDCLTISFIYRLDGAKYQTRPDGTINTSKIIGPYKKVLISKGVAPLKADAQQYAATEALKVLSSQGFVKHPPSIYAKFSSCEEKKETSKFDILKICKSSKNINDLFQTKGKSKYQTKYMSTILLKYCRQRDYDAIKICLEMGADPNIPDTDLITSTDVLFIGPVNVTLVRNILTLFLKTYKTLNMYKMIKDTYLELYVSEDPEFFTHFSSIVKITENVVIQGQQISYEDDDEL